MMKIVINSSADNKRYISVNLLAAAVIILNYINASVFIRGISIVTTGIIWVYCFIGYIKRTFIMYSEALFLIFFVILSILISDIFIPEDHYTILYLERFLFYDLISLLIGIQKFDEKKVLQNTLILGIVFLPLLLRVNFVETDTGTWTGLSYAILPIFLSAIIGLSFEKGYRIISVFLLIVYLMILMRYGIRGFWLITFLFLLILFYRLSVDKISDKKDKIKALLILSVIVLLVCIVYFNLSQIIIFIRSFLINHFDIRIYALDKYIYYLGKDNITNGRDGLYSEALKIIKENWLVGRGVGYYESKTGYYVHNIFLQSMCEGGIIYLIPILFLVIYSIFRLLFYGNIKLDNYKTSYFIMIFFCSFAVLLFSSVIWQLNIFWFFCGNVIRYLNEDKQSIE